MLGKAEWRGGLLMLAALLALAMAVMTVTPGLPGELLLQSLRPHLLAAGLFLFIALLIVGVRWRALLFLIVVLAVAAHTALLIHQVLKLRETPAGTAVGGLKLLSYNVLNSNAQPDDAARFIIDTAPDVAVLMETGGVESQLGDIAKVLPYSVGCTVSARCDISIHSRYPIEASAMLPMAPFYHERRAWARINVGGQAVTILAVHLSKPYFDEASWVELDQIRETLSRIEGPVIVAGDFNAAFWSTPVAVFARDQKLAPGPWPPATWPVEFGALGVPIDNVFARGAEVTGIEAVDDSHGSNHKALLARIALYAAP